MKICRYTVKRLFVSNIFRNCKCLVIIAFLHALEFVLQGNTKEYISIP